MTEPTPPPERPLGDEARARIRAELLAHAHEHRSGAPRWLVPAGAAAAVALVAGMAYWAISPGDGGTSVGPAGGGTSSAPAAPTQAESSATPAPTVASTPAGTSVPEPPMPTVQVGTGSCRAELENVLRGASLAFEFAEAGDGPDSSTSYWIKGDRFSLCYAVEGSTTVTRPLPLEAQDDVTTYRVLSLYPPTRDGYRTVRVAGGLVPPGAEQVFDVAYTFPDGHTEHAQKATDDQGRTFWLMAYSYDDGGGNETRKPPISVTVSYSGVQQHYELAWGVDTCAQANHGC